MKTKLWAILIVILCSFFIAAGELFMKYGVNNTTSTLIGLATSLNVWIGLFLYGTGAILLLISFKGGDLSVLYPFLALSFIWVNFLSSYFLNEPLNIYKNLGIILIFLGVSSMGRGVKNE